MKAALVGKYLEFVVFKGVAERYPMWFAEELYRCINLDEGRFTLWMYKPERSIDYYEKQLIEDDSVFLMKPDGDMFVTNWDTLEKMYTTFIYNDFTNSGVVAFNDDCIEYVECRAGTLIDDYPEWFYEYFTEAVNYPHVETIYFLDKQDRLVSNMDIGNGEVVVSDRCVFLRNKFGEIRSMTYSAFLEYYDPNPEAEL